jgi:hypothetical protein
MGFCDPEWSCVMFKIGCFNASIATVVAPKADATDRLNAMREQVRSGNLRQVLGDQRTTIEIRPPQAYASEKRK